MSSQSPTSGRRRSSRAHALISAAEQDVYAIEAIICRSLHPAVGPTGEEEYFYLVRWEGYAPEHDSWEPRSNLTNSSQAVKEYEVTETPFSLLDIRNSKGYEPSYLVRFGMATRLIPPSPHYPQVWLTVPQLKQYCRATTVDAAVKLIHRPASPRPARQDRRSSQSTKGAAAVRKYITKPRQPVDIVIIACRKKQQGKGVGQWNQFHVQWQEKGHPKDAWFGRSELVHLFGGSGDKAIKLFRAEMETPKVAETSVKESDYERERKRNIEENKVLMRDLGL